MKILLILLVLFASGCSSFDRTKNSLSNNSGGAEQLGKIRTISIVSPAEEEQLALAVARARELHAQIRAYDAAIGAAKQLQAQTRVKTSQARMIGRVSVPVAHRSPNKFAAQTKTPPIRSAGLSQPLRGQSVANWNNLALRDWIAPVTQAQFRYTRPKFSAELTSQPPAGPMFELGMPTTMKPLGQKAVSVAPARVGSM
jgi:hypothetical protein